MNTGFPKLPVPPPPPHPEGLIPRRQQYLTLKAHSHHHDAELNNVWGVAWFSTAMSPNSPYRNHNWLSLLQITEQGLIQTTSRSVAAVCASEATKMFNVIF